MYRRLLASVAAVLVVTNKKHVTLFAPGTVSGGTGELGEQHPFGLCRCVRASSRENWDPSFIAGRDLSVREGDRLGKQTGCIHILSTNLIVSHGYVEHITQEDKTSSYRVYRLPRTINRSIWLIFSSLSFPTWK